LTSLFNAIEASPVHVLGCSEQEVDNLVGVQSLRLPQECVIRFIRGKRCQTAAGLFQEFAAALQFPYYFGHNWDALDECLGDLYWLPARLYILVITNAQLLLSSGKRDELKTLWSVLMDARSELSEPAGDDPRPRQAAQLHYLLQAEPDEVDKTIKKLEVAGVTARWSEEFLELQPPS